jgi:hypothetical protein
MATISAGFGRVPGRVSPGSPSSYRKESMLSAKGGMAEIIRRYESLIKRLEGVTPTVLHNALLPVFRKSQIYVPKKTGALMASGRMNVYPGPKGQAEGEIVYGDAKAWYAALVHEFVWLNHPSPTQAKYLQRAMEEELDAFLVSLAVDYAQVMA